MRPLLPLILLLIAAVVAPGQEAAFAPPLTGQHRTLVDRALAAELAAVTDQSHPMRYQLRKSSPRLTSTKEIVETRDGYVARLVAVFDRPLSLAEQQVEDARLDALLRDPGQQRHRKQAEEEDLARAAKVLRALPTAFLYRFAGVAETPSGRVERFTFTPNPAFSPNELETQVLPAMAGELWINPAHERVARLEAHVLREVNFGWGILGRLNRGGWVAIDQADVGNGQWRVVRFEMRMSGRVLFRNKSFDTVEEQSQFTPLPAGLDYRQAIQMLRSREDGASKDSR